MSFFTVRTVPSSGKGGECWPRREAESQRNSHSLDWCSSGGALSHSLDLCSSGGALSHSLDWCSSGGALSHSLDWCSSGRRNLIGHAVAHHYMRNRVPIRGPSTQTLKKLAFWRNAHSTIDRFNADLKNAFNCMSSFFISSFLRRNSTCVGSHYWWTD